MSGLCGELDTYQTGRKFQVSIPAGIDNGQSIRIRDKGEPGTNGGPRGDLLVEVTVSRHPIFTRQDMNIFSTAPITFAQAALGGDVRISTVDGDVIYNVKSGNKDRYKSALKRERCSVSPQQTSSRRPLCHTCDPDTGEIKCRGKRSA